MEPEQIKNRPCSLSEAIREGAKIRPQVTHVLFRDGASCAMGAAIEALTGRYEDRDSLLTDVLYRMLEQEYKSTLYLPASCPVLGGVNCDTKEQIGYVVTHLNDVHKWTREAIADWLESEEEKLGFVTVVESAQTEVSEVVMV